MNSTCKECMLNKHLSNYPEDAPEELVREYRETLVRLTDQTGAVPTGPEVFYLARERWITRRSNVILTR